MGITVPKRVFDRSTLYESRVIDMHTGKPVHAETKPMICDCIRHYREKLGIEQKALAAMVGRYGQCCKQQGKRVRSPRRKSSAEHLQSASNHALPALWSGRSFRQITTATAWSRITRMTV